MRRFITTAIALCLVTILVGALSPALAQSPGPGLFVTSVRLNPGQPAFNQNVSFYATFSNTTSAVQNFNWKVYIFRADTPSHSNNETTAQMTNFPVGSGEYPALGSFRYGATGYTCEYFSARVGWLNADSKITYFTSPDGNMYQKGFSVCDISTIPTPVPPTPAPTAPPPTPGPGVRISDIAFDPAQPVFNRNVNFNVSFNNTASGPQSFDWKVYIFRADTPGHSNNETTTQTTEFPSGASQAAALGSFRYGPTGSTCEYFNARVGWLDADSRITFFPGADGNFFQKGFSICDPSFYAPTATPAPAGFGVFVSGVTLSPDRPAFSQNISFNVAFSNTTGSDKTFPWKVYIFKADTSSHSNNETSEQTTIFPNGASQNAALGTFRYGATGYTCEYFYAQVGWLDQNNAVTYFAAPDGKTYQKAFSICDASTLPTPVPPTPAPTSPPPTPGPGILVSAMDLDPAQPVFNRNIGFNVSFNNTASGPQSFDWKVYIFRADTPGHSNNETTTQSTEFPTGASQESTLGNFRYGATGNTCEYFFARVGWLDADNHITYFPQADGNVFQKGFSVCDASFYVPAPTPVPAGYGLFVTGVTLSPAQPAYNQNVAFNVAFSNATGSDKTFPWKIYIFRADTSSHSSNETSLQTTTFPNGASQDDALGSFRYGPTGYTCDYFYAEVGWLDQNDNVTYFTSPDGKVFQKGFAVCDPSAIPTTVAPTAAPTAPPPPPGPGVFVTSVRLQPFDTPQHKMPTTFFATFQNTSNAALSFSWRILVYRADTLGHSNFDTTIQSSTFQSGSVEVQSPGTFNYGSTGNNCDFFIARVGWLDSNNKVTFFTTPDGKVYEKGFQVCN